MLILVNTPIRDADSSPHIQGSCKKGWVDRGTWLQPGPPRREARGDDIWICIPLLLWGLQVRRIIRSEFQTAVANTMEMALIASRVDIDLEQGQNTIYRRVVGSESRRFVCDRELPSGRQRSCKCTASSQVSGNKQRFGKNKLQTWAQLTVWSGQRQ